MFPIPTSSELMNIHDLIMNNSFQGFSVFGSKSASMSQPHQMKHFFMETSNQKCASSGHVLEKFDYYIRLKVLSRIKG